MIKLKLKQDGTYHKQVVYTKVVNGMPLNKQRDMLRELIHIKFPNTEKLVIDSQGVGAGLSTMFYESWEYRDLKSGVVSEFPPLIEDDDEESKKLLENAMPIIRCIHGVNTFINEYYPYMKACFENKNLELLQQSADVDIMYKTNHITYEEYEQHVQHDILQSELSNIKQDFTGNEKMTYTRIVKATKRDRATSLMYGLSYISEKENNNKKNIYKRKTSSSVGGILSMARKPSVIGRYH